jgi:hypothetical protein
VLESKILQPMYLKIYVKKIAKKSKESRPGGPGIGLPLEGASDQSALMVRGRIQGFRPKTEQRLIFIRLSQMSLTWS